MKERRKKESSMKRTRWKKLNTYNGKKRKRNIERKETRQNYEERTMKNQRTKYRKKGFENRNFF